MTTCHLTHEQKQTVRPIKHKALGKSWVNSLIQTRGSPQGNIQDTEKHGQNHSNTTATEGPGVLYTLCSLLEMHKCTN